MDIKKIVENLIKECETTDIYKICSYKDVHILYDFLSPMKAYFTTYKRINLIVIDESLEGEEKDFIIAHEFGHYMLHKGINHNFYSNFTFFSNLKVEKEANDFAVYLTLIKFGYKDLINIEDFKRIFLNSIGGHQIGFI